MTDTLNTLVAFLFYDFNMVNASLLSFSVLLLAGAGMTWLGLNLADQVAGD